MSTREKMLEIARNLQFGDKARAIREIPISEPTLNKYLAGDVTKLKLAERIISYFENLNK